MGNSHKNHLVWNQSTKLWWNSHWMVLFQNCVRLKVWFQLSNWFQTRRFLCEFPIGSYVKLSSAVGAILVEGPNRLTYFWKRTIQWLFHQHLVPIEQMVSNKTLVEWSLDGPLAKLCLVIPTSNQDGHQAKNRKKGGWNLKKIFSSVTTEPISTKLCWNDPLVVPFQIMSGISDLRPK
jgi:hypothetical protein